MIAGNKIGLRAVEKEDLPLLEIGEIYLNLKAL